MAGILDFLNTPDAQLGIGLLAAGGPTTDPNQTGLGQRVAGAMQSTRNAQLQQAQIAEAQQKAMLQRVQLQNEVNWQNMLGGNQTSGLPQETPSAFSPSQPSPTTGMSDPSGAPAMGGSASPGMGSQGGPMGLPNLPGRSAAESTQIALGLGRGGYMQTLATQGGPQTDSAKMMAQMGIDPKSPLGQQISQAALFKTNYIQDVSGRPGGYLKSANGTITQLPHVPDGFTAIQGADGQFHMVPVDGGLAAMQQSAGASALGKAGAEPTVAYNGNTPIFSTKAQDVGRAQVGAPTTQPGYTSAFNGLPAAQPGMSSSFEGSPEKILPLIAGMKDPQERANAYDAYSRQMTGGAAPAQPQGATPILPPGVNEGAKLSQDELSGKYKDLTADNSSAPTVISRLQNIKLLAPGAITGAETSRRDFFNGLLSLGGIKGAEDAKKASDLVDKNSAQIVSALRMGQGGAGTDALQTLLSAANPNRKMTVEAMNDAADQLIASQKMVQAKSALLTPHALSRDPVSYGTKEQTFDQAADPRIWQWQSIQNPAAKKAFAAQLAKSDPSIPGKIQALEQMGALK